MKIQMPNSKILQGLMGWMIAAAVLRFGRIIQADHLTGGQMIANFLLDLVFRYLLGAFWSGFPLVYASAMIAAAVFVTAVVVRGPYAKPAATYAFITIMGLSLFSLWIEPWITAFGVISNLLLISFGLFSVVVEICVSIGWLFLWAWTQDELKANL